MRGQPGETMSTRITRSFLALGLALFAAGLTFQSCRKPGNAPDSRAAEAPSREQPLRFSHKAHIDAEEMECLDCHAFAEKSAHATLPRIKDCSDCHSEPQGKHPDEPKVRDYLDAEREIPWIRVNRLPGHVYFSHRAHVGFAEMKCTECHGDMRNAVKPLVRSDIRHLTMSTCISCHREKKASNECSTCHR